ncbi:MAG TPA: 7TM diverse intracellular signaling domain-containing protein [Polyangiales bacterium]|nr:7TM diverse intracellular signaling domain-containing protein [Polyangiales bacterium]
MFFSALLAGPMSLTAAGQPAFVLDRVMDGRMLGGHQAVFEDVDSRYTIEQVSRGAQGVSFKPTTSDAPAFGFSKAAAWLRFTVENPTTSTREWLLEFTYPHVDSIELYIPTANGGFERRASGDRRPFRERDLAYRNVVFRLKQPPGPATYYLRAQTTGSLILPLVAWTEESFIGHMNTQQPALWMFYGVMLAIALYNLFIFVSVHHVSYFYYVIHTLAYALFQFALNGLAYQYLWPNAVWWANQCMPVCISFAMFTGVQFHRNFLDLKHNLPRTDRTMRWLGTYATLATTLLSLFVPYAIGIRMVVALGTAIIAAALYSAARLVLRRHRPAYFYGAAWGILLAGIMAYLLKTMNVLPTNFVTEWSIQIGASLESILLSLGLADRINVMRRDLQDLNVRLGDNVQQLSTALERAEDARRAKSEFLAGVSHELRTPLNTIINVPDGLREEFQSTPTVSCKRCATAFELEPGEVPNLDSPCPECTAVGALSLTQHHVYRGSPQETLRYLDQVVRSGNHLLEVVNDILDVSRLEAGQMRVHKQPTDMRALFERVVAPMSGLAEHSGVTLQWGELPESCVVYGDSTKLGQILINLVGNAIKFSDGRGSVQVSVRRDGSDFVFSVRDQGIGISQEDQARIFESFVQAEGGGTRRFGGSGLGLAITRKLVVLHQGEIWVESEPGRGSTFFVRLPAYSAPPIQAETSGERRPSQRVAGAAR